MAKLASESVPSTSTVLDRIRAPDWSQAGLGFVPGSSTYLLWGCQPVPQFPFVRESKNITNGQLPEKEAQRAFNINMFYFTHINTRAGAGPVAQAVTAPCS